jgi:hypothetical protein
MFASRRKEMESFFVLEYALPGPWVIDVRYKHVQCSVCGLRPVARVGGTSVRFREEPELVDFTRTAGGILVRRSVLKILREARISGWRPGLITVETAEELSEHDTEYDEMVVIGHTRGYSEQVRLEIEAQCSECGRLVYVRPKRGLSMQRQCWDGSDIFQIDELPGIYVVTDAFREVIETHQCTGVEFVALDEWRNWV